MSDLEVHFSDCYQRGEWIAFSPDFWSLYWPQHYLCFVVLKRMGTFRNVHQFKGIGWAIMVLKFTVKVRGFLFSMAQRPPSGPGPHDHRRFTKTLRHTTLGTTPLNKWSVPRRYLYLTTHNTHKRQTSKTPAGFEPGIPAKPAAAEPTPEGINILREIFQSRILSSHFFPLKCARMPAIWNTGVQFPAHAKIFIFVITFQLSLWDLPCLLPILCQGLFLERPIDRSRKFTIHFHIAQHPFTPWCHGSEKSA